MNIAFHGAARTVTGSKHLITLKNGTQILLDCGLFQGMGRITDKLNDFFGFDAKKVTYLVLSHAHIDHCGLLPKLVAEGFEGKIFCTSATMDLARILMMDSAKIQMQDAEFSNRHLREGEEMEEPLYTDEDVTKTVSQMKIVEYEEDFEIEAGIRLKFTDAGHILGSAAVHLTITEDGKPIRIT